MAIFCGQKSIHKVALYTLQIALSNQINLQEIMKETTQ